MTVAAPASTRVRLVCGICWRLPNGTPVWIPAGTRGTAIARDDALPLTDATIVRVRFDGPFPEAPCMQEELEWV